jgi:hypothetical protein
VSAEREELLERLESNVTAAKKAHEAAEKTPFVPGSVGQLREHPGFRVAARCDEIAVKLARELGITATSRATAFDELDGFDELTQRRTRRRR